MVNIYVHGAGAIAASILPSHLMRTVNCNHVLCLTEVGCLSLWLTTRKQA